MRFARDVDAACRYALNPIILNHHVYPVINFYTKITL